MFDMSSHYFLAGFPGDSAIGQSDGFSMAQPSAMGEEE